MFPNFFFLFVELAPPPFSMSFKHTAMFCSLLRAFRKHQSFCFFARPSAQDSCGFLWGSNYRNLRNFGALVGSPCCAMCRIGGSSGMVVLLSEGGGSEEEGVAPDHVLGLLFLSLALLDTTVQAEEEPEDIDLEDSDDDGEPDDEDDDDDNDGID